MTLDLHVPKGQEIVRRLVAQCDVVLENFRPGVLERWGLGWDALHAVNPRLVMARITAFGQTGPLNQGPGYAAIGSAFGGTWYVNGPADRPAGAPDAGLPRLHDRALHGVRRAGGAPPSRRDRRGAVDRRRALRVRVSRHGVHDDALRPAGRRARARRSAALGLAGRRLSRRRTASGSSSRRRPSTCSSGSAR